MSTNNKSGNGGNGGFSATVAAMLAKNEDSIPNAAVAAAVAIQAETKAKEDAQAALRVLKEIESTLNDAVDNLRMVRKQEAAAGVYVRAIDAAGTEFAKTGNVTAWGEARMKARNAFFASR